MLYRITVQVVVHFLHRFFGFEGDAAVVEREDYGKQNWWEKRDGKNTDYESSQRTPLFHFANWS